MKPMAMKNVEPGPKSNNFDSATPFENSSYTTRLGNRYDNIHYHYSVPVITSAFRTSRAEHYSPRGISCGEMLLPWPAGSWGAGALQHINQKCSFS